MLQARTQFRAFEYGGTVHIAAGGVNAYVTAAVESVLGDRVGVTAEHIYSESLPIAKQMVNATIVGNRAYLFAGSGRFGPPPHRTVHFAIVGPPPNAAPVADAGDDITIECAGPSGTPVTLNGLLSSDPDGDTLAFTWQGAFPEGGGTVTGPMPTVTLPRGTHTVSLTVMDTYGEMSSDTVIVTVEDTQAPLLSGVPADVTVEATGPDGAAFALASPLATDACEGPVPVLHDAPTFFSLGQTLVTFSATDSSGNGVTASTVVTVVDTTAPEIGDVTPAKSSLWPPNHEMVSVDIAVAVSDLVDLHPACQIASVSSNEPSDGLGDGDTSPDWIVTGALSVDLRAERAGGGSGRVYTIAVECADASGNAVQASTIVSVPQSRGR